MINIPGYSVSGEIGRGGMAVVYRARQVLLDREVALKVLNPQLAQDPVYAQRFLQEARMLAALGHPHIVPVYDVGVTPDGLHYFSMQLIPGGDFSRKLREGIDEVELVRVLLAVAQALGFAHTRGYVHRDVTPANILFDERLRPILTDFGIARALAATSRITASGLSIGTSHYMSPEQARGQEVDRRSDIYSLGVLLFEALAGKPPFDGDDGFAVAYAHVHEPVPRLPEGIERWQPLVDRAMAKQPEERFDDCAAFIDGLQHTAPAEFAAVVKREGVSAIAPPIPPAGARPTPKSEKAAKPPQPAPSVAAASPSMIKVAAERASRTPLYLALGLVIGGLALIGAIWLTSGDNDVVVVVPTPAPIANPAPTREPATTPEPAQDDAPVTLPEDTTLTEQDRIDGDLETAQAIALGELPTVEDPVARLLAMGRANIAAQRLSSPPGGNALDRYRLALQIEPGNADAKAGIAAVAQAYLERARKRDRDAGLEPWLEDLARAEGIARDNDVPAALAQATALRQAYVDERLAAGAQAILEWRRDDAIAQHQLALRALPDSDAVRKGLRAAEGVGQAGYVFRDGTAQSQAPSMVVVGALALSQREISVAEFGVYWRDAGRAKFGATPPSCRDRESFFRSSRKRTWQDPDIDQSERHPVVCVSFAMAEDYARWLGQRSGQRYRLPKASEWRAAAGSPFPAKCAGNVRDAAFKAKFGGREGADCSDGHAATAPGGAFAVRKPGLYDVDGNVREWVSDCSSGGCKERLALGASWYSLAGDPVAPAYSADTGFNTIGFRVLREIERSP